MKFLPKLSSVDSQIVLSDLYETKFNIFDHAAQSRLPSTPLGPDYRARPLSSVAFHPAEDINTGSLLEEMMRLYIMRSIHGLFGLNFLEFMSLPKDVIDLMLVVSDEEGVRKQTALNAIENELNGAGKK